MSNFSQSGGGHSRRDFIKIAAGSLGGALLTSFGTGCAGAGSSIGGNFGGLGGPLGTSPLPNGYVFHRIFTPGVDGQFPDLESLSGGVLCNESSIVFHGVRNSKQVAVYELDMGYNGDSAPTIQDAVVRAQEGSLTPDGVMIDKIQAAALNNGGELSSLAIVIGTKGVSDPKRASNEGTPILYVDDRGQGMAPLVQHRDDAPGGGKFGAHFGDVAINDNNDVLFIADYSVEDDKGMHILQGAFLANGSTNGSSAKLLASASSAAPDSKLPIRFGLCDLDSSSQGYILQTFASRPGANGGEISAGLIGAAHGAAPVHLTGYSGLLGSESGLNGNVFMGARLNKNHVTSVVHSPDGNTTTLLQNTTPIMTSGEMSPTGKRVANIGPAAIDDNGLSYFLVTTDAGMELVVSNGTSRRTILQHGDKVANFSAPVASIVQGYHADQVDPHGKIVFIVDFQDGSQSIVVGIPI